MQEVKSNNNARRRIAPDPKAQYLYTLAMCWSKSGQLNVTSDRKVENVRLVNGHYQFNFVGEDPKKVYECYYGWVFVLVNQENLARYQHSQAIKKQAEELDAKLGFIRSTISTLEVPA